MGNGKNNFSVNAKKRGLSSKFSIFVSFIVFSCLRAVQPESVNWYAAPLQSRDLIERYVVYKWKDTMKVCKPDLKSVDHCRTTSSPAAKFKSDLRSVGWCSRPFFTLSCLVARTWREASMNLAASAPAISTVPAAQNIPALNQLVRVCVRARLRACMRLRVTSTEKYCARSRVKHWVQQDRAYG